MMVVTLNTGATMRKCVDMTYLLSYLVIVFPIYLMHEGQLTTGQLVKFWACRYYHLSGRHVAPGWIAVYELLLYYNTINPSRSLYCYSLKLSMSPLMAKVMLSTQENPQNPRSQTWEGRRNWLPASEFSVYAPWDPSWSFCWFYTLSTVSSKQGSTEFFLCCITVWTNCAGNQALSPWRCKGLAVDVQALQSPSSPVLRIC